MPAAQIKTKIITNRRLKANYWHLEFESGLIARSARPGQFVNIRVNDLLEPLLRRPLSIHGVKGARVKVIYEVLGKGTQALSQRKSGEFLDIIGPLGNGFDYPSAAKSKGKYILVAGGMGVAPLLFLAEKLKTLKPLVLIGARAKELIICTPEFKALGAEIKLATDDGSAGFNGRVTQLLEIELKQTRAAVIFACGPHPMLKAAAQIAASSQLPAQLSLEAHMACGIGACLGCVVSTKDGYKSVCKDGPVFSGQDLIW